MKLSCLQRVAALERLCRVIQEYPSQLEKAVCKAGQANTWFDQRHVHRMLDAICNSMIPPRAVQSLVEHYKLTEVACPRVVAQVPAGNLPLVGFHDFVLTFLVGHKSQVKLSEKDNVLFPALMSIWQQEIPEISDYVDIVERLNGFEAVIATGSNNTARYFEKYFCAYPHIIRHNRNSVAILHGHEKADDLAALSDDILAYYGLGCRNVSHVYLPKQMPIDPLLEAVAQQSDVMLNTRYANNFDYQRAILLFNGAAHYNSGNVLWMESDAIPSPISMVHYSRYEHPAALITRLERNAAHIQCVATDSPINCSLPQVKLGQTQRPSLTDYPDGVDVTAFLLTL